MVTFTDEASVEKASRDFFRVFGVLLTRSPSAAATDSRSFHDVEDHDSEMEEPGGEKYRTTYPEPAEYKNTLLLTGLPWQFPVATLLSEIGARLTKDSAGGKDSSVSVSLRLANSKIYDFPTTDTIGIKTTKAIDKLQVPLLKLRLRAVGVKLNAKVETTRSRVDECKKQGSPRTSEVEDE